MPSVHELVDLFIADVCAGKDNETPKSYRGKLKRLELFLEDRPLTKAELSAFRMHLFNFREHYHGTRKVEGGLSIFTVRSVLGTVRNFCHWLYENEYTETNLAKTLKLPPQPQPQPKAIREEDFTALLQAAGLHGGPWLQARNLALLYWLRDTGGRISGALNATMANIDLEQGIVVTEEKSKTVTRFFSSVTVEALRAWEGYRQELDPQDEHIFISDSNKIGLTRSAVYGIFNYLAKDAGISGRKNPHSFRHAFARDFLRNGGELTQLAGILGHTSITVTYNYYARWNTRELQSAHDKFSPLNPKNRKEKTQ